MIQTLLLLIYSSSSIVLIICGVWIIIHREPQRSTRIRDMAVESRIPTALEQSRAHMKEWEERWWQEFSSLPQYTVTLFSHQETAIEWRDRMMREEYTMIEHRDWGSNRINRIVLGKDGRVREERESWSDIRSKRLEILEELARNRQYDASNRRNP